jgi:hypothetical protein
VSLRALVVTRKFFAACMIPSRLQPTSVPWVSLSILCLSPNPLRLRHCRHGLEMADEASHGCRKFGARGTMKDTRDTVDEAWCVVSK